MGGRTSNPIDSPDSYRTTTVRSRRALNGTDTRGGHRGYRDGAGEIGIISSGWDSNWVYFFEGVVLLAAVMLNTAIRRRAERAR